jgi:DNA-binding protein, YbaB/EbfC family
MNIQELMKQAQKMQGEMAAIESELNEKIYEGSAGGVVNARVDGTYTIHEVKVGKEVLEDVEMLEEMLVLALNDALSQAKTEREQRLGALTQGMGMPGGY